LPTPAVHPFIILLRPLYGCAGGTYFHANGEGGTKRYRQGVGVLGRSTYLGGEFGRKCADKIVSGGDFKTIKLLLF